MTQPRESLRASAIARDLDLSPTARELLREEFTPEQFLAALHAHKLWDDGLLFLARWLPRREAILVGLRVHLAFASTCAARQSGRGALKAAVRWVVEPNEASRRAAEQASNAAGMSTASGCVAAAVFLSGGSISRPGLPVVEAPTDAMATIIAKALIAATASPREGPGHRERFLQLGHQVAMSNNRWERPQHAARA